MSHSEEGCSNGDEKKYNGVRRRKWGKWVSEIRVPGTRDRLWLGSYSTPEAAAVAHDTALFCLRGPSSAGHLNFPILLPRILQADMSPRSIQKAASAAALAVDAQLTKKLPENEKPVENDEITPYLDQTQIWDDKYVHSEMNEGSSSVEGEALSISVEDMEIYL
ncbi:PREDICTED: ethylene-responsive transcription factor ERF020 [Nelumbo nucifera]|uniref:AP2/ERF domain-containing protein n=2 Tax=Nelumbo nucifera TaxID=4432 RepID=A0A822Z2R9_NELNU|nr:PREDICTED: ethylene-responsive transcription factor ERF020 [Nelumbo nucifera]DAD38990.1 TPA_asm: hypothetical protein HUJ06_013313 [Nelumbo nucifera]